MTVTKVLVCKVGEEPKVEEVLQPFYYCQERLLGGGYIEAKLITVNKARVVCYWDEDGDQKNLPFNRNVPALAMPVPPHDFSIDMRKDPPEAYAKPGELGYFPVRGNFLITKANSKGDHISLSDEEIQTLIPLLPVPTRQGG